MIWQSVTAVNLNKNSAKVNLKTICLHIETERSSKIADSQPLILLQIVSANILPKFSGVHKIAIFRFGAAIVTDVL